MFKNRADNLPGHDEIGLMNILLKNGTSFSEYDMALARSTKNFLLICLALGVLAGFYLTNTYNYLLFHTLAELFSIVIAGGIFMIAWNVRKLLNSEYLLFFGIAYLSVGSLDLVHMLTYEGMRLLPRDGADTATQLWVASRYLESLSLLASPFFLRRRVGVTALLAGFSIIVVSVLISIFYLGIFPACFREGTGLTPFKKYSEYVISLILVGAAVQFYRYRRYQDRAVLFWLLIAIGLTIASELSFTTYGQTYSLANLVGHYFKILSYFCIYKAIIETGLTRPYSLLFHELKNSEQELQRASQDLERKVRERTRVLRATVEDLSEEVKKRLAAENMLRQLSRKSIDALESERKSVAKELHDSIGASLAAIKFILEDVRSTMSTNLEHPLQQIQKAIYYLADTIQESKRISARLRPLTLEELGLLPTIKAYTRQFEELYKDIRVDLKVTATEEQIPDHLKIVVYRILQEALNNIGKHSRAARVWICLSTDQRMVRFRLQDNGVGFDVDEAVSAGHGLQGYGLQSMRERTEIIGGSFSLTSSPGQGTCIAVALPLHPSDDMDGRCPIRSLRFP